MNIINTPESRIKANENRVKNLTPLFEMNRLIQKKNRIETRIAVLNKERGGLQKEINSILSTLGVNNPVQTVGNSYGKIQQALRDYLKNQSEGKTVIDIHRTLGLNYQSITQSLRKRQDIFRQLSEPGRRARWQEGLRALRP